MINNQSDNQQQQTNQSFHCQIVAKKQELICTTEAKSPMAGVKLDPVAINTTLHELTLLLVAMTRFSQAISSLVRDRQKQKIKKKVQPKLHENS